MTIIIIIIRWVECDIIRIMPKHEDLCETLKRFFVIWAGSEFVFHDKKYGNEFHFLTSLLNHVNSCWTKFVYK